MITLITTKGKNVNTPAAWAMKILRLTKANQLDGFFLKTVAPPLLFNWVFKILLIIET
jgi:hypothetical protein